MMDMGMLLVLCYPQTTTICLPFLSTHTDMDDFERHVIIHLVMRSVALVCMMLLPLYLAMSLLLLPVFDMNSVIWRESCTPLLPVTATEMANIPPLLNTAQIRFWNCAALINPVQART